VRLSIPIRLKQVALQYGLENWHHPKAGRLKRAMPSNGRFTKDFVKMVNKQNTYQKCCSPILVMYQL
jgi:hypothetical protein